MIFRVFTPTQHLLYQGFVGSSGTQRPEIECYWIWWQLTHVQIQEPNKAPFVPWLRIGTNVFVGGIDVLESMLIVFGYKLSVFIVHITRVHRSIRWVVHELLNLQAMLLINTPQHKVKPNTIKHSSLQCLWHVRS